MSTAKQNLSGIEDLLFVVKDYVPTGLVELKDTPTGYLGHSGDYLVVNDGESGIHFTGIEKIASDLTDYGFGGVLDIPKYTFLPDATDNDNKIVASGCDLYYSCGGSWRKIGAEDIPPPENIPGCVSNLEEYNQYQEYKEEFLANHLNVSFSAGLLDSADISDFIFDVCLFSDQEGSTVKIDETTYKWGMFNGTQTINITATTGDQTNFLYWSGDDAVFGDSNNPQTTLLVDKDLSVTGHFESTQPGPSDLICEDVMLYLKTDGVSSSQTFADLSSHNHPITLEGKQDIEYSSSQQLFGSNTIWFNGSDGTKNYLTIDTGSLALGTDDYTIEFWIKATKGTHYRRIISQSEGTISVGGQYPNSSLDLMILDNGRLQLRSEVAYFQATKITTSHIVGDNNWHHVAIVRGSEKTSIYVDGLISTSTTSAAFLASFPETNFHIGDLPVLISSHDSFSLNGYIGGLRVVKKELYTENFDLPTNLFNNPC